MESESRLASQDGHIIVEVQRVFGRADKRNAIMIMVRNNISVELHSRLLDHHKLVISAGSQRKTILP